MEHRNGEVHLDTDEARAGSSSNVVRWVLGIGLLLAAIGLTLAWVIPSLSRGPERHMDYSEKTDDERRPVDVNPDTRAPAVPRAPGLPAPAVSDTTTSTLSTVRNTDKSQ